MSSIPLTALAVQPPQDPLKQYSELMGIRNAQGEQQTRSLQNQLLGSQVADQAKWQAAMSETAANGGSTDDLMQAALKHQVSPQSLTTMQNAITDHQTKLAQLNKDQLANLQTQNDMYRGRIMSVVNGPEGDKQASWSDEIQKEKAAGKVDPNFSEIYPGDQAAQAMADRLALGSTLAKEASEKTTANARQTTAQTGASEFAAKQNPQSPLYSPTPASIAMGTAPGAQQIQSGEAAQAGRVAGAQEAAKFPYQQQIESIRQQVGQSTQLNKDAQDKIEMNVLKPYSDKMASVAELQSAIQQAQAGNVTAARGVLLKLIGVSNPDGTKRFNNQEAERLLSQGGIPQRIAGSVKNLLTGDNWTDQMASDMSDFANAQGQVAAASLNRGIQDTNKLYGTNVGTGLLQQSGGSGGAPSPGSPAKLPPGATHKVPGPDGKMHYTNAQGTVDYGVVQ
jgi:hypothetical protein